MYTLQLYNFIGKKVAEVIPNSPRFVFSLNGFTRGIYVYQLRDQYGRVLDSGKIQVVK